MKTRIVYPQLWLDEKFVLCSLETKVLFNYLINNIYLNLSRYCRISDRKILFETGLTDEQLKNGKRELSELKWIFFYGEWMYHNHDCAYVDYEGNYRVKGAKAKEVSQVPSEIRQVLKGLVKNGGGDNKSLVDQSEINGSETGSQPYINKKLKTINHKTEIGMGLIRGRLQERGLMQ